MMRTNKETQYRSRLVEQATLVVMLIAGLSLTALSQSETLASKDAKPSETQKPKAIVIEPKIKELKGVELNMTMDQVKDILGKPKVGDKTSMYFDLKGDESMQIEFDEDGKVRMAALIFTKKAESPKFFDVFDEDVAYAPAADGRVYKLVNYPNAGYWVAYGKLVLADGPMTTITMQKID